MNPGIENKDTPPQGPDPAYVRRIFSSISRRYDIANRVLSLGLDQLWRKSLIAGCLSRTQSPSHILDLACGTGDVAIALRKRVDGKVQITGGDFSKEMLDQARIKSSAVNWVELDATSLPQGTESIDLVTIAFGLRNVNDTVRALKEMYRVLRPGGVIGILEFGQPEQSTLGRVFGRFIQLLNRLWLQVIGGRITGHAWAYRYLSQSSEKFPGAEGLSRLAQAALATAPTPPAMSQKRLFPGICYALYLTKPGYP